MLCHLCKTLITDILSGNIEENGSWNKNRYRGYEFEFNYGSLEHLSACSASKSCDLCHMILQKHCVNSGSRRNSMGPLPLSGSVSVTVELDGASQMPLYFTTDTLPAFPGWRTHSERYELFLFNNKGTRPPPRIRSAEDVAGVNQLHVNLSHFMSSALVEDLRLEASFESCNAMIAMIQEWSASCLGNHSSCSSRKKDQRLPTRVLDVGRIGGQEEPWLFEPNGQYGTYLTLSHRWGTASKQFQTTRANLMSHRTRIPFKSFPVLFHDAIQVTRLLGIRYLWIDCLCIIQDDDDDWKKECGKMASIYENSFLTISALLAKHSGQTIFPNRVEGVKPVLLRMANGTLVRLRPSTLSLTDAVKYSVLDNRGWVLQERVLSPAIVHYGSNQMYWECLGGQADEISPLSKSRISSMTKNLLHEAQRPGCELYPGGNYIAWYIVIQLYTRKCLTVETDRLTAILDLAARFARSFGGTFVAGLWAEDLHRGLLWKDSRFDKFSGWSGPREVRQEVVSPSWSWVNCGGSVAFEWDMTLYTPTRIHPVARIPTNTEAEFVDAYTSACKNKHRGAVKGRIQLWGVVKRVCCLSQTLQGVAQRLDETDVPVSVANSYKANVLRRRLKDTNIELPCVVDFDFEASIDCYCVIIADWTFEDSWKVFHKSKQSVQPVDLRCFLVLQRTRKLHRHRNPLDFGEFKRIGVGAASISSVEQFFGSRRKYFLTLV